MEKAKREKLNEKSMIFIYSASAPTLIGNMDPENRRLIDWQAEAANCFC
jgi:hypothetical protein